MFNLVQCYLTATQPGPKTSSFCDITIIASASNGFSCASLILCDRDYGYFTVCQTESNLKFNALIFYSTVTISESS
eukprot:g54947.t1